jgi:hypothetical protein
MVKDNSRGAIKQVDAISYHINIQRERRYGSLSC